MNFIFLFSKKENSLKFFIPPGSHKVGRSPEASFVINAMPVSRFHALVDREGDTVWLTDLDSKNGTFVNGQKLDKQVRTLLLPGDAIVFGNEAHTFFVHGNIAATPSATPASGEPTAAAPTQALPQLDFGGVDQPTQPHDFGFDAGTISYAEEGIDLRTADRLASKYRPIQLLNAGGMGKIFLVQERLSSRFVALKVMIERYLHSEPHVQQFVREAVITARLQHPHVIPVYDLGFVEANQLYYTMRYIDGENLSETMKLSNLETILTVLRQAALAVDYAHSLGLWHRDLKPGNILVNHLGEAFVIDWGLVSVQAGKNYQLDLPRILVERESFVFKDTLLRDTQNAISTADISGGGLGSAPLIGTPAYMAPEQCSGDRSKMGILSDVWAFGVMLFEALTGQHPIPDHRTLSPRKIANRIIDTPLPAPGSIQPGLPSLLEELCVAMLAHNPVQRPSSLHPFIQRLDAYLSSSS